MTEAPITPFDSIESAHDFVSVLSETVAEAKQEIEVDLQRELNAKAPRRREALRIAAYNLAKLETHMNASRRILNDLRSLRRLLFAERQRVVRIAAKTDTSVWIPMDLEANMLSEAPSRQSPKPLVGIASPASGKRQINVAA